MSRSPALELLKRYRITIKTDFRNGCGFRAVSSSSTTWGCARPLTGPFARRFYPNGVLGLAPGSV